MKIIYNKILPIKGYKIINLFGIFFVRINSDGTKPKILWEDINHETIHTEQMKELLYIGFYIWYFFEWLIRLLLEPSSAYRSISFEREAYANENNLHYLHDRKRFNWIQYLRK